MTKGFTEAEETEMAEQPNPEIETEKEESRNGPPFDVSHICEEVERENRERMCGSDK